MRILHIVHQYLPEHVGGTELYTQSLARAQSMAGHRAAIFYPSSAPPAPSPPLSVRDEVGIYLYPLPLGSRSRTAVFWSTFRRPEMVRHFRRVLAEEQPDLVHVQHLMGMPAAIVDQIVAAGVPFLVTLHDYWYPCANAQLITNYDHTLCAGPDKWMNCGRCLLARAGHDSRAAAPLLAPLLAYRSRLLHHVLERAAAVIAPSQFVRRQYEALGMPAARLIVVPHGIAVPPALPVRTVGGDRAGTFHVVYVGGIAPQKGVHILVDAVNGMPENSIRLTVYGNLALFPEYVQQLRAEARHPGIHFAGQISREALWPALAEADVLAVPSLWHETYSLVTQEALAAGLPVLASDLGALSERVQNGGNGLLLPPGDSAAWRRALERLSIDPSFLADLQPDARSIRTIEDHISELEALYLRVIEESRPTRK